ncbi:endolytic transglycosylase MltG [Martelella endophytica]|uniref:Endolytic murein transglycosylase n=1 Tax=Martelella endophytica TaxID=1486262 RepID=A0A0D5LTD6_MAREN|nr:endolytic transglycosylase MltG [Martelella endophytica]AJY46638.1 4-amino-4-deoxychorismate lyase [Martelella endophytica]
MSGQDQGREHSDTSGNGRRPIVPKSAKEALRPERVPPPVQRSRKAKSQVIVFLNFLMTLVVLGCAAAIGIYYYAMSSYRDPGPLAVNTEFTVRSGTGLATISRDLENAGIISDSRIFRYVTTAHMRDGETLKAGDYEIKAGASMQEIADLFESGKTILFSISFPEGLTVQEIFDKLAEDPDLAGDLPDELPPEGSLMPQTFRYSRGTARTEILAQMEAGQQKLVDDIWLKRDPDLPIDSKEELVTLASIVEKETGLAEERPRVAAVFLNRLKKGMRLQSDPTVIYGLFGGEGKPSDRPIYRSDLEKETPYNTYRINGLPPGPIANPGRAALEAVANPARTEDLYFVADGSGGHAFASTLDDHNANVRRWRELEAQEQSN